MYSGIIAIKSTVLPGTTESLIGQYPNLKICMVPEFLRAKSALADFVNNHDVLVVGTDNNYVYEQIVASHKLIPKSSSRVTPTEAEIVKYFSNLYNALRIVFANNMFEVCQKTKADYQNVLQAITKKRGILPDYLLCSANYRGFGGHCLPKDTEAFASFAQSLGLTDLNLFSAIVNDNKNFK
jgi:UDP-glucose 6-dehydrogenase